MRALRFAAFVPVAALATACSSEGVSVPPAEHGALPRAFDDAAARAHVPRDLLVAIAVVEDGLTIPATREVEADAPIPIAGPLQLRRGKLDTLALGARLSGRSELELRQDADLALGAGALVVADVGARTGARRTTSGRGRPRSRRWAASQTLRIACSMHTKCSRCSRAAGRSPGATETSSRSRRTICRRT